MAEKTIEKNKSINKTKKVTQPKTKKAKQDPKNTTQKQKKTTQSQIKKQEENNIQKSVEVTSKKETEQEEKNDFKKQVKKNKKTPIILKIIITILILIIVGILTLLFLLYGPISTFRDWWITTAMTTMSHKYLAEWFFSEDVINEVLSRNKIEDTHETTNTDLIVIMPPEETVEYKNEFEKQILAPNLDKDKYNIYAEGKNYRIIKVSGKGYSGYLAAIYDPSKVEVATSKYLGNSGQYLTEISKQNDAVIAINGGGFQDEGSHGNGSTPLGIIFSKGKFISNNQFTEIGGVVGFDNNDKLVLGKMTLAQARNLGIRDSVTFGPFLIVNGEPAKIYGNGGWGTAPRTAIGQRQDGVVLFLVLDGRRLTMPGATIKDLIEIMQNYGAYNASNLDGGTSSAMTFNSKIINDPVDASGNHRTRQIATAFILKDDEEN